MVKRPLPEPLSQNAWKQKVEELCSKSTPVNFKGLIDIAREAGSLRVAFDPEWQTGMNRESRVSYYRAEIFALHNIEPFPSRLQIDYAAQESLEAIFANCLTDTDIWDAASHVMSEIVRDEHPLLPSSRVWVSEILAGRYKRPKESAGPHPLKYDARNRMVVGFLFELAKHGVPITENDASFLGQSACHAISEALSEYYTVPSPKTLMNIWSNRSQNWKSISRNE